MTYLKKRMPVLKEMTCGKKNPKWLMRLCAAEYPVKKKPTRSGEPRRVAKRTARMRISRMAPRTPSPSSARTPARSSASSAQSSVGAPSPKLWRGAAVSSKQNPMKVLTKYLQEVANAHGCISKDIEKTKGHLRVLIAQKEDIGEKIRKHTTVLEQMVAEERSLAMVLEQGSDFGKEHVGKNIDMKDSEVHKEE